jgi:hypothetical protein
MKQLVNHIAEGLKWIDSSGVPFRNYQPGVGPYGEPQVVKKIIEYIREEYPDYYANTKTKRVPDVLIPNKWALEFKIVRPFGDNGKEAEHWSQNLIHPYEGNVGSVGDAIKLLKSDFDERKGIIVIAYEHMPPIIKVEVLVECFEFIARNIVNIPLGNRNSAKIMDLIHPVHQQCTVYGWELGCFEIR